MQNRRFTSRNYQQFALPIGICLMTILLLFQISKSVIPREEVIHIVYMLGGNSYTRHLFHTHLKSLLSFSNSSLHLHVIADSENIEDVTVLLDTWHLPRCQYTFYDEKDYTDKISWVHAQHYSKQFGYLKLEIPYILKDFEKVLILDVDIVMQVDVKEMWDMLGNFNETNFLALVRTTSPWYTSGHPTAWPARGSGYNSGVLLMDLVKMRSIGFDEKWRNLTERHYARIGSNPIADQDIFNTWVYENPETFYEIPCQYNFEIGGRSRQRLCPQTPLLIHFNTPSKQPNKGLERFSEVRQIYVDMDGEVFRRTRTPLSVSTDKDYRIIPNAYGRRDPNKLCWGTYLGVEQLDTFMEHASHWNLPISVVLIGTDMEVGLLSDKVNSLRRKDITIHNVFGQGDMTDKKKFLRDIIIDNSNCDQFLISDVDFDFVGDLGKLLKASTMGSKNGSDKKADKKGDKKNSK